MPWPPSSEAELQQLLDDGVLEESAILEFKREPGSRNDRIARSIAALANDGGTLIYGVAEGKSGRADTLHAFALKGVPERVSNIIQTTVSESLDIEIRTIFSSTDPDEGYLWIEVPASPRAPHMVLGSGHNRFYGRGPKGVVPLSQGEVARLYRRRQEKEIDRETFVHEIMLDCPRDSSACGRLTLFARPVLASDTLLEGLDDDDPNIWHELLSEAKARDVYSAPFHPEFRESSSRRISSGWMIFLSSKPHEGESRKPYFVLDLQVSFGGLLTLHAGTVANYSNDGPIVSEAAVAGITTRLLKYSGALYRRVGYFGQVDIGVGVGGIEGAYAAAARRELGHSYGPSYSSESYTRTDRVSARQLDEKPREVARLLLNRFFRELCRDLPDPLGPPEETLS